MTRAPRIVSGVLIAAGVLAGAWAIVVWRWQDPFTALYTHWEQQKLGHELTREFADFRPARSTRGLALAAERDIVAAEAARFRRTTHAGEPIARIVIGRIGSKTGTICARTCRDRTGSSTSRATGRRTSRRSPTSTPSARATRFASRCRTRPSLPDDETHRRARDGPVRPAVAEARGAGAAGVPSALFATHRYIVYAKLVAMTPRA